MSRGKHETARLQTVARLALKFGLELSAVPGASSAVDLLSTIIGLQSEQNHLLESIAQDTARLRLAPLKTAETYIGEAARVGINDSRYTGLLEKAQHYLFEARSLANSPHERAFVELEVTAIATLQERHQDARHWIGACYASTQEGLDMLVSTAKKRTIQTASSYNYRLIDARDERQPIKPYNWSDALIRLTLLDAYPSATTRIADRENKARIRALVEYLAFHETVRTWHVTLVITGRHPRQMALYRKLRRPPRSQGLLSRKTDPEWDLVLAPSGDPRLVGLHRVALGDKDLA